MEQTIRHKTNLRNISVNFRVTQLEKLKSLALKEGFTTSALIRKIVDSYFGKAQ